MKKVASIAIIMFFLTPCLFTISYADDLTPEEAYYMVRDYANVYIVDVRTPAEWQWVGHPGPNLKGEGAFLAGKVVNISWWIEKHGIWHVNNDSFIKDVNEFFEDIENPVLITMCRSGHRSGLARDLLELEGYTAHNMLTGFQGDRDEFGYRTVNGWVIDGWPYTDGRGGVYPDQRLGGKNSGTGLSVDNTYIKPPFAEDSIPFFLSGLLSKELWDSGQSLKG